MRGIFAVNMPRGEALSLVDLAILVLMYPRAHASRNAEFGAISPCEMNEFSDECEAWEAENGPYEKGEYMVKSNSRTKGR